MLLFWLFPEALAGTKFLRYALSLMPFVYMTASIGIVQMWSVLSGLIDKLVAGTRIVRTAGALALSAAFVVAPAVLTINVLLRGYPSLFVNVFGGNQAGYFFPHDEFYDLGARESIRFIAETAPPQAMMASEIPGVAQYYLERFNRTDIRSRIISQPSFTLSAGQPDYVLLQPGRVYFENLDNFRFIEKSFSVAQSSIYDGVAASRVYVTGNR